MRVEGKYQMNSIIPRIIQQCGMIVVHARGKVWCGMGDYGFEDLGLNDDDLRHFLDRERAEDRRKLKVRNAVSIELNRILHELTGVALDLEKFLDEYNKK